MSLITFSVPGIASTTYEYLCKANAHLINLLFEVLFFFKNVNGLWSVCMRNGLSRRYFEKCPTEKTTAKASFSIIGYLASLSFSFLDA